MPFISVKTIPRSNSFVEGIFVEADWSRLGRVFKLIPVVYIVRLEAPTHKGRNA